MEVGPWYLEDDGNKDILDDRENSQSLEVVTCYR